METERAKPYWYRILTLALLLIASSSMGGRNAKRSALKGMSFEADAPSVEAASAKRCRTGNQIEIFRDVQAPTAALNTAFSKNGALRLSIAQIALHSRRKSPSRIRPSSRPGERT